jgi:HJR/Mrr/RecB family endonuclease
MAKDNSGIGGVVFILIAGNLWIYRTGLMQVGLVVACLLAVMMFAPVLFKALKWLMGRRGSDPSIQPIDNMTGLEFERFVANKLKEQGYTEVKITEEYDLGVDIIAEKDGLRWGIQVKRYFGLVGANAVRQVVTALRYYGCNRAMVVTNSLFSQVAIKLAACNKCKLIDRSLLLKARYNS